MLVSGVTVFAAGYHHGDIAGGADWSTFFYGLARVGYSFTLGVLAMQIYRERGRRVSYRSVAVVITLMAVLLVPLPAELRRLYDPLMVQSACPRSCGSERAPKSLQPYRDWPLSWGTSHTRSMRFIFRSW